MKFEELFEKYQRLLIENNQLKEEIKGLKVQYGMIETQNVSSGEICAQKYEQETTCAEVAVHITTPAINNNSDPNDKIKLFMSLFKGRDDVYAKRWENSKKGTSGYSPVCANEWRPGVCQKAKTKCAGCSYKDYLPISEKVIDDHLRGRSNLVAGTVKECVKDYGMVVVDECHHVSAFSFEEVLKCANSKYVYGMTATPARKDGHHPIIFMQCGAIRYRDDAKKQAEKRPFEHYIIPRFTSFKGPLDKSENDVTIQDYYSDIVVNEMRNQLIIDDIARSHEAGRNCLVLTERTAHVEILSNTLVKRIPDVISVTGGMGTKETRKTMAKIANTPFDRPLTLVATGKYIGEGFDEPRLDTLFLAMPISWKGTLQQYAGRLHRLFDGKNEVQVYDYVDIHVRMLEKMYNKRFVGYASIGYKAKSESFATESPDIIFDKSNFLPVYCNDIMKANREILVVSPFVTKKRSMQMLKNLEVALANSVKVIVLTRPVNDFIGKDMTSLQETLDLLKNAGIRIIYKSNIHQKFAVIDQRIIWYGSINLMSFGSAEESIMRLESPVIANELIKDIEK
jgi:hypothetical protein